MAKNTAFATILLALLLVPPASAQGGGTISGVVKDDDGEPISGATVLVVETQRSTATARDGIFTLKLAAGTYTVLATATGRQIDQARATVIDGGTAELELVLGQALSQFGEELVVIGSRSQRTAIETPVPVDVFSGEEIHDGGTTETSRILQILAPSFNVSTSTISDGTDIVRPGTLRGLGPDQTLVLVNGKRRHTSALVHVNGSIGRGTAGTDLNAIPASAIERIEVLRDGAAAQYGSDAIAGVVNVVLRTDTDQTRVSMTAGQHFEGDGENVQLGLSRGFRIGDRGYVNVAAEYRDRGWTNRAGRDPRRIYNFLEQVYAEPALSSGTPDPREQTYDRRNHRYGDAASENLYLFVNSSIPTSDSSEFYFFGGFSERDGESAGFNRLPSQSRTSILIYPDGHLPFINTSIDDLSLSAGLRKTFGSGWSLDASLTTGGNQLNFFITSSANTSLGLASPTEADAGTLSFHQTTVNLDLFARFGKVNLAFGLERREDAYEIEAGEPASWIDGGVPDQFGGVAPAGIQVFPGFRPSNEVDASRDNVAAYADVEWNVSERFLVGLAGRFEDYSDFGSTLDGKLTFRFEVTDAFAVRGAASTGFRAPSLHQSSFNNISTQFVDVGGVITPLEVGTFRVDSEVAKALGAEPLREEISRSMSFGFTAKPARSFSITLDVFKISIDDRIVVSGRFEASNPQIAPLLAPFGVSAAQFFTNAIDTETEGVDLVAAYTREVGPGVLDLTGAANWNKTEVTGDVRTPPELEGLGETLFPLIDRTYVELAQPRELYHLGVRYSQGGFAALLRHNKYGAVSATESDTDPTAFQTFSGKWITDLDLSYRLTNGVKFSIGGNNVFDVYPDKNVPRNSFNGIFVYPRRTAPFGFNGGYYYARVTFEF